jgi:hypothetical protein
MSTTTTAPLIIAHIAPDAATLDGVLTEWHREAKDEAARAAKAQDSAGVAYALERMNATRRALGALTRADRAGRTLIVETRAGALLVAGNGGDYLVSLDGMGLTCDCPHGLQLAAAERGATDATGEPVKAPRGLCYHVVLAQALTEAQIRAGERADERAADDATRLHGVSDRDVLLSFDAAPAPLAGDWTEAALSAWYDELMSDRRRAA